MDVRFPAPGPGLTASPGRGMMAHPTMLNVEVLADAETAAARAAEVIAAAARDAVAERGGFVFAVSGGKTPWHMLRALAGLDVPWPAVHLFQVDERIAPDGHPESEPHAAA